MTKVKIFIRGFWKNRILPLIAITKKMFGKVLKICYKTAIRIVSASALAVVFAFPFLSKVIDHDIAQWHWYPACALYLILLIVDRIRRKESAFKGPIFDFYAKVGEFLVLPVFSSIFVFNYYDIGYIWYWVIFGMVAIAAPCYFFSLFLFDIKHRPRSEEERKTVALNICKYILLYWLYDLFYMAIFNSWDILIYVFGIIAIVVIFYNLTSVFLNGAKTLQFLLPFDLLFGIALTVYLIYIIPDDKLRNIILTIVASVLGGLLALVGVAWTIKHTNSARLEDLSRIENEHKEEERKKHIPYIRISFEKELPPIVVNAHITKGMDFSDPDDLELIEGNVYFTVNVHDFSVKNVSNANIILKGVVLHQKFYTFSQEEIVEPGACCRVKTTNNYWIAMPKVDTAISLVIDDILGNTYEVNCPVSYSRDSMRLKTVFEIDGSEYIGYDYEYVVSSVQLPVLTVRDSEE